MWHGNRGYLHLVLSNFGLAYVLLLRPVFKICYVFRSLNFEHPSLCESFKFLQDRRSGESRYFTRPYTISPDRQILCDYAKLWYMYIKLILLLLQNILHCFSIKYIQTVRSFCNFLRTNFRFFTRRPFPFVEKIYQPNSKFTSKNWRSCDFCIDWHPSVLLYFYFTWNHAWLHRQNLHMIAQKVFICNIFIYVKHDITIQEYIVPYVGNPLLLFGEGSILVGGDISYPFSRCCFT